MSKSPDIRIQGESTGCRELDEALRRLMGNVKHHNGAVVKCHWGSGSGACPVLLVQMDGVYVVHPDECQMRCFGVKLI